MKNIKIILIVILFCLAIMSNCSLQSGYVFVSVTDRNGVPLKDTKVTINKNGKVISELKTLKSGAAHFSDIPNDDYDVTVKPQKKYENTTVKINKEDMKNDNPLSVKIIVKLKQ